MVSMALPRLRLVYFAFSKSRDSWLRLILIVPFPLRSRTVTISALSCCCSIIGCLVNISFLVNGETENFKSRFRYNVQIRSVQI